MGQRAYSWFWVVEENGCGCGSSVETDVGCVEEKKGAFLGRWSPNKTVCASPAEIVVCLVRFSSMCDR